MQDKKSSGKRREVTLRLNDEEFERLRKFAFDHDLKHQTVVYDALMKHIDSEKVVTEAPKPPPQKAADQKWHDMLAEVLADSVDRIGIEKNLEWACTAVRQRRPRPATHEHRRAGGS
jgi:hypothetical protein